MWKLRHFLKYLRLSKLSKNYELIKEMIENHISSSHDITQIPLFEFQQKFKEKASEEELKEVYYNAKDELT